MSQSSPLRLASRNSKAEAKQRGPGKSSSATKCSRLIACWARFPARLEVVVRPVVALAEALERRLHHRLPWIVFLATNKIPGAEPRVVGGAAVLEIVHVVGNEMRVDAGLAQQLGEGVVEGLERPPAPMHEAQPAGVEIAPCRHAGQAADEMPVEGHGPLGEPVEVGRTDGRPAIAAHGRAIQRVEKNKDRFHGALALAAS